MIVNASTDDYFYLYWTNYDPIKYEYYEKPTAGFSLSCNGQTVFSDSGVELNIKLGDTITINNYGTVASYRVKRDSNGKNYVTKERNNITGYDWQVYGDTSVGKVTVANGVLSSLPSSIKLQYTGTYDFYLCVRDDQPDMPSDGNTKWQNWSANGSHRSYGTSSTGKKMWWYFVHIRVNVTSDKPIADMEFSDTSSATKNIYLGESFTLVDKSYAMTEGASIVGWSVKAGENPQTYITNPSSFFTTYTPKYTGTYKYTLYYVHDSNSAKSENPAKTLTVIVSQKPQPGQGKVIYEYYKDSVSPDNLLGTNTVGISNPYVVVLPDTYGDNLGFKSATYSGGAVSEGGSCKNGTSITIKDTTKDLIIQAIYKAGSSGPSYYPPTAIIDAPSTVMAGESLKADGKRSHSNNEGGFIAAYYWDYDGANLIRNNGSDIRIWYPEEGNYTIYLDIEDERGNTEWTEHDVKVTPPIPTAVIKYTGKLKENRKITLDSSESTSPTYYPIDISKTTWTIIPVSGGTADDIKYIGTLNGNVTKDILFKKAGTYKVKLTVTNTYGKSASTEVTLNIQPDLPPIAKIALPAPEGMIYQVYREPSDNNYATFEIYNESYSPDGDIINKAVVFYCYDADNDGNYKEETWYYSKNGTTWQPVGMSYEQMVSNFNIFNIATSNVPKFTLKTKDVGKYYYFIRVMEDIPANETIPIFITESDYKRADNFD